MGNIWLVAMALIGGFLGGWAHSYYRSKKLSVYNMQRIEEMIDEILAEKEGAK